MNCKYCGKPIATQEDYDTIPEGEGEHLCWSEFGSPCMSADEALEKARERIADLEEKLALIESKPEKRMRKQRIEVGDRYRHSTGIYSVDWVCSDGGGQEFGETSLGLVNYNMTWTGMEQELEELGFSRVVDDNDQHEPLPKAGSRKDC